MFHGGGWSTGEPAWTFSTAQRFADWGLVAIAVEYRLSDDSMTPIDALADVCAALRWARTTTDFDHGARLAGYGVSAGGHLVTAAATVGCPDNTPPPDALLLWSPALDVERDGWFKRLLRGRAPAVAYSPAAHVRRTTPPTSIVHGEEDTLTPLAGARRYCEALRRVGGRCDLNTYPRLGHLLTRNLAEQEQNFDPDPKARADGIERHRRFLVSLGFLAR
jgi:acetyl esterase/lipase